MSDKWQLCPKCNGQGTVSKPPWVAGDVHQWTASQTSFTCDVCLGQKALRTPDERKHEPWEHSYPWVAGEVDDE